METQLSHINYLFVWTCASHKLSSDPKDKYRKCWWTIRSEIPPLPLLFLYSLAEFILCFQIPIDKNWRTKVQLGFAQVAIWRVPSFSKQLDFSRQGSISVKPHVPPSWDPITGGWNLKRAGIQEHAVFSKVTFTTMQQCNCIHFLLFLGSRIK